MRRAAQVTRFMRRNDCGEIWSFGPSTSPRKGDRPTSEVGSEAGWMARGLRRAAFVAVLALLSVPGASGNADQGHAGRGRPVELEFQSVSALHQALRRHPATLLELVGPLRIAEVRPTGPAADFSRAVRREPGILSARL